MKILSKFLQKRFKKKRGSLTGKFQSLIYSEIFFIKVRLSHTQFKVKESITRVPNKTSGQDIKIN